jgi:hypothetical protein
MNRIEEDFLHMLLTTDDGTAVDCARSLAKC